MNTLQRGERFRNCVFYGRRDRGFPDMHNRSDGVNQVTRPDEPPGCDAVGVVFRDNGVPISIAIPHRPKASVAPVKQEWNTLEADLC
jgi:hypothetical protein